MKLLTAIVVGSLGLSLSAFAQMGSAGTSSGSGGMSGGNSGSGTASGVGAGNSGNTNMGSGNPSTGIHQSAGNTPDGGASSDSVKHAHHNTSTKTQSNSELSNPATPGSTN